MINEDAANQWQTRQDRALRTFEEKFRTWPVERQYRAWVALKTVSLDTTGYFHPDTTAARHRLEELNGKLCEQQAVMQEAVQMGRAGRDATVRGQGAIAELEAHVARTAAAEDKGYRTNDAALWDITEKRDHTNRLNKQRAEIAEGVLNELPQRAQHRLLELMTAALEQGEPGLPFERLHRSKRLRTAAIERDGAMTALVEARTTLATYLDEHPISSRWSQTADRLRGEVLQAAQRLGALQHNLESSSKAIERQYSVQLDRNRWGRGIVAGKLDRQRAMASDPRQRISMEQVAAKYRARPPERLDFGRSFVVAGTLEHSGRSFAILADHQSRLLVERSDTSAALTRGATVTILHDGHIRRAPTPTPSHDRGRGR